jgi:hypothetical protein
VTGHKQGWEMPEVLIGGVRVPRVILGNLPFLGESYQGPEKNKEYVRRFSDVRATTSLLEKAFRQHGVTAISTMPPSTDRLTALFYLALKAASIETGTEPGIIACFMIPLRIGGRPVDDYRRWVTYHSIEAGGDGDVTEKYLKDPILLCREGWGEKFPQALRCTSPYGSDEICDLAYDETGLEETLRPLRDHKVLLVEAGSETDFLAMTGRVDLLNDVIDQARNILNCPVVVGTHHAGSTIPILENSKTGLAGYVTPVNSLGALMLPRQGKALQAIESSTRPIIAIKPMAGGRVPPEQAFRYAFGKVGADGCMIGAASEEELEVDIREVRRALELREHSPLPGKNQISSFPLGIR